MDVETVNHVLRKYFEAAEAARDGTFYAQCKQRKPYLTKEIIRKWHIGKAPTLAQCKAAGLSVEELQETGLYVERTHGWVMFFRDAMVFPFVDGGWYAGRLVYVTSRRLVDHDPKTGEPLTKQGKALSMRAPDGKGWGGLLLGAGYNVDAIGSDEATECGVLLVEGPADALACTERGHPAVGMVGKSPREALLSRLQGKVTYLALDGTADVTPLERLTCASRISPDCFVCEVPQGQDPDDLRANELVALKVAARPVLDLWLELFQSPPDKWPENITSEFQQHVVRWVEVEPTREETLKQRVQGSLNLTGSEWRDFLQGRAKTDIQAHAPTGQAEEFLDKQFPAMLAEIDQHKGTGRDAKVLELLQQLVPIVAEGSEVLRDRIRSAVCDGTGLGRRSYDKALREAARTVQGKDGACSSGDVDWFALARAWRMMLRYE
jgi:DNA primase